MPDESYEEAKLRLLLEFAGLRTATFSLRSFGDFEIKKRMIDDGIILADVIDPLTATSTGTITINGKTQEKTTQTKTLGMATIREILKPGLELIAPFLGEIDSEITSMNDVQLEAEVENPRPQNQRYVLSLREMGARRVAKELVERKASEQERIDTERRHREQIAVAKEQSSSAKLLSILALVIALGAAIATGLQAYYAYLALPKSSVSKAVATPIPLARPESQPEAASDQPAKAETPTKAEARTPEPKATPAPAPKSGQSPKEVHREGKLLVE